MGETGLRSHRFLHLCWGSTARGGLQVFFGAINAQIGSVEEEGSQRRREKTSALVFKFVAWLIPSLTTFRVVHEVENGEAPPNPFNNQESR